MSKKKSFAMSEDWLKDKGYVQQPDGSWTPPKLKSEFVRQQREANREELVVKQKVTETNNFLVKPVTEWFIKTSVPSKKNGRINFVSKEGKQMSLPSKKHKEYVASTEMQYDVFGREFRNTVNALGITPPYRIEFTFVRDTKHQFDYCNACQTCEDMMKDQFDRKGNLKRKGWFQDDSADFIIPSFAPYEYDKSNPGVRIKIITNK